MKLYSICLYLLLNLIEGALIEELDTISSYKPYEITNEKVVRLRPKGFRISIPYNDKYTVTQVVFKARINKPLEDDDLTDFIATIREPTNGSWVFDNINSHVEAGTKIYYGINVHFGLAYLIKRVSRMATLSENFIDIRPRQIKGCSALACELSETTVRRKPVCKGDLIFEDNFNSLDMNVWRNEVRIPVDHEYSFVSYQNRSENCYVGNGQLHIVPTLLSDGPGFNESLIQTGYLHLEDCMYMEDSTRECRKFAKFSQILPPIVSAKIHTKESFSFRYGRVEIRAKLPTGDWIFPLILLNPLEKFYGYTGYASGQMRVVFARGNKFLLDKDGKDISSRAVSGGLVLEHENPLRFMKLKFREAQDRLGSQFHNYSLTWTPTGIAVAMDSVEYGFHRFSTLTDNDHNIRLAKIRNNGHPNAPFDREFFLTLGVAVGGHAFFPDGCRNGVIQEEKPWKNGDPKAMFRFWKDRQNWQNTWHGDDAGLHIDFIRVYAL